MDADIEYRQMIQGHKDEQAAQDAEDHQDE